MATLAVRAQSSRFPLADRLGSSLAERQDQMEAVTKRLAVRWVAYRVMVPEERLS